MWGDCVGVAVIEKLSQKELMTTPVEEESEDEDGLENIELIEKDTELDHLNENC